MNQIESFIRHWRRAAAFMIVGGLIGWILWMFLPQQFTAITHLSVGIDYNRTGKLTDLEEDRLIGVSEDMLHSYEVMEQVFRQSSIPDYQTFFEKTLTTRTNETWILAVTGTNPEEIGRLAVLWLDIAYDSLLTAKEHALKAEAYQNELEGLTRCIQDSAAVSISSGCPENRQEIMDQIDSYTHLIQDELSLSHGLSTAIQIGPKNSGQLELRSASRTAAADTLLGAFVGLLLAFAMVWFTKNGKSE